MKRFVQKRFFMGLFALAFIGSQLNAECCFLKDRCCGEPLFCGSFDIQVQGGVAPIVWLNRGEFDAVLPTQFPAAPVQKVTDIPKFDKFFHLPWTVGAQVGYSYTDHARLYFEFNYVQARSKCRTLPIEPAINPMNLVLDFTPRDYRLFDFYLGARYYTCRWWCNTTSFFVGAKVGVTHHQRTDFGLRVHDAGEIIFFTQSDKVPMFKRSTSVSGGINLGLDFCLWSNFYLVLTGEVVASCGPKANVNIPISVPDVTVTNFQFTGIGTELRFPVTVALRYNF